MALSRHCRSGAFATSLLGLALLAAPAAGCKDAGKDKSGTKATPDVTSTSKSGSTSKSASSSKSGGGHATESSKPAASSAAAAPPGPLDGFVKYSNSEGHFEMMLPRTPGPVETSPFEKEGIKTTMNVISLQEGNTAYAVNFSEIPLQVTDVKKFLTDSRDGAFKAVGATMESSKEIKVGKYPGLDSVGSHPQVGKLRSRVIARTTNKSVWQYQVMILGAVPEDKAVATLESFKITN